MRISDEQAKRAVDLLRHGGVEQWEARNRDIDPAIIARAVELATDSPDSRPDAVAEARWMLEQHPPSAEEVAAKILSRMASDSLR
ncbi:MAG: hypothetical protein HY876_08860 [Coriobacteriales bacterium]|nr:hypothetical protein [Coriobacteriales bacterium]